MKMIDNMNTKYISLAISAVAFAALLSGCAKSPVEESVEQQSDLELAFVGSNETKAVIDGTAFPTDGHVGLFLFADEAADSPYGDGYENVEYTYNSIKDKWTASPSIKVGSTPGYLFGYYPYNVAITDVTAIPVISSLNGDDVMFALPVKNVTDQTAPQTIITMNHALARVAITVVNKGYTGAAKLSSIKFSGAGTAAAGTLDATDGTLTATKADVSLDVPTSIQTVTDSGSTFECLLVPSSTVEDRQTLTLTLTIDGQEKSATLSGDNGVVIAQNTKSSITVNLSNSGITVRTVSVVDWNVVEAGGHTVTVAVADGVDPNDILTKAYVDGDNVIIKAYSESGQHLKCTLGEGVFCPQSKTDKLAYTFTLSDIGSDVTATIGYAKPVTVNVSSNHTDWGTAKFDGDCYEGERICFTASVKGSRCGFVEWQDAVGKKLEWSNPQYITLSSNLSVNAVFNAPVGVFSVSNDGGNTTKQIHFSPGNLWAKGSVFDPTFNFENEQYEFHTYEPGKSWGLFSWSTDNIENTYGMTTSGEPSVFYGAFVDWGRAIGDGETWRTLTSAEWQYLFNSRQNTANKFGHATVADVHGIIVLPDEFIDPMKNKGDKFFVPLSTPGWDANVYTSGGDWEAMEDAGAVFLPAAGRRNYDVVADVGVSGYYWSTTPSTDQFSAYCMSFLSNYFDLSDQNYRRSGYSIRLVTEYQNGPDAE